MKISMKLWSIKSRIVMPFVMSVLYLLASWYGHYDVDFLQTRPGAASGFSVILRWSPPSAVSQAGQGGLS